MPKILFNKYLLFNQIEQGYILNIQYIWNFTTGGSSVFVSDSRNQFCKYFARTFLSISILCFPLVVRKVFLIVAIVVLVNHSLNVLNTKAAVVSPLILYGYAIFHAKFFNAIWVTVERLLMRISVLDSGWRLVKKYRTHSQIWKTSASSNPKRKIYLAYILTSQ